MAAVRLATSTVVVGAVIHYLQSVYKDVITAAFTKILACVGETATAITGSPFLLFTVIFLFAGGVIGIMGRILSRN